MRTLHNKGKHGRPKSPCRGKRRALGAVGLGALCALAVGAPLAWEHGGALAIEEAAGQPASLGVPEASAAPAATSTVEKQQVVYVKESATGAQEGVYVVNVFDAEADATVTDGAPYASLTNLTDSQKLAPAAGDVTFTVAGGTTFRYQGDLAPTAPTPWVMDIAYTLDGRSVEPAKLDGAEGRVGMTLTVEPNEACAGDFAENYLLQITGALAGDAVRNVSAPDATVAQAGDATQLSYMLLPGKSATYEISFDARNFAFDGFQMVGVPLALALEVDDEQLGDATGELNELADAVEQLNDGSRTLDEGTASARDGAAELASASTSLRSGTANARDALGALASGSSALSKAINGSLVEGAETLAEGSGAYAAGLEAKAAELEQQAQAAASSAEDKQGAYEQAMTRFTEAYSQAFAQALMAQMQAGATTPDATAAAAQALASSPVQSAQATVQEALEALVSAQATSAGAGAASSALGEAAAGYAPLDKGLQGLVDADSEASVYVLGQAAADLSSGLARANEGLSSLESGVGSYTAGVDSLDDGLGELADGTAALSSAMGELFTETRGIDQKLVDGVRDKLEEYLNPDFQPTDFATGSPETQRVQFVYKTAALTA